MPLQSPALPVLLGALLLGAPALSSAQDAPLEEMSLEDLMNVNIVSASNVAERLFEAPATVIVIARDEIGKRGYRDLSELLEDLPGMDVVRAWGSTYIKNYWRGYRNSIGDPFLIMVDGVVLNHLYFNTADVLATFPLSSVERVEVVYGPASSVYGPNAFMGVVNVITPAVAEGSTLRGTLSAGSAQSRVADLYAAYGREGLRASLGVRVEAGLVQPADRESYEYTRERYFADRSLWGGFVDNPNIAGAFLSRRRHRALDARVGLGDTEIVLQHYVLDSGYGLEYAGDRAQANAIWARPDTSVFLRHGHALGPRGRSSTLLRWRSSGVSNDSTFLESYPGTLRAPAQTGAFSYWQSLNTSWSLFQDFEGRSGERLSFNAGFKYERKDLQKAYETSYGAAVPVALIDARTYPFPTPPVAVPEAPNRIVTEDRGAYVQGRLRLRQHHLVNVGVRHDDNSKYGGATSLRAGYVGSFGRWGVKLLYGEGFQEPTPRQLYGGWKGSGSDPDLEPERSRTLELAGSFTTRRLRTLVNAYRILNRQTIVNTVRGAQNLGDRAVFGTDAHAVLRARPRGLHELSLWAYASHIFEAYEKTREVPVREAPIGDLARTQLHAGLTATRDAHWSAALRGRWTAARDTVASNPVRTVPAYGVLDFTLTCDDLPWKGLGLMLAATNVLDAHYFHPGVRDASAGERPGSFDATGLWTGSAGYYNSLLPQPGREARLVLRLRF